MGVYFCTQNPKIFPTVF
ncbi:MAG: hypothetical protein ACLRP4_00880 [Dialister invisus]